MRGKIPAKRIVISLNSDFLMIVLLGIADKIDLQIGVDFFVRTRRKTGRREVLCGGFSAEVRAKKMRQDGDAEFISASFISAQMKKPAV